MTGNNDRRTERHEFLQGLAPVARMRWRTADVRNRRHHQIADDQDSFVWQVDDDVAAGVSAAKITNLDNPFAAMQSDSIVEGDSWQNDLDAGVLGHIALGDLDVALIGRLFLLIHRAARYAFVFGQPVLEGGDECRR